MEKSKEALAIKLNLEFDEVVSLFSEETLSSMEQEDLLGGNGGTQIICPNIRLFCPTQAGICVGNHTGVCATLPPLHSPTPEPANPGITTTPSYP